MTALSRRCFLSNTVTGIAASKPFRVFRAAAPKAIVEEIRVISWEKNLYHGWPTIARRSRGELLLAYSGGRTTHQDPFGRLELMRSQDSGRTWSWPQVIYDSPLDDRDGGILETARGTLLITTFTNRKSESLLEEAGKIPAGSPDAWETGEIDAWRAAIDRLPAVQRKAELGCWMIRSTDGGLTWSSRYRVPLNSPHGPVQLSDGRLLFPGIARWTEQQKMGVCSSSDDGLTWQWLADIADRPGDARFRDPVTFNYLELTAVECPDGRIVCQLRNRNKRNDGETLQSESDDGGKSWSPIHPIGVWGSPSHLLLLKDGRLLMTYGHRRPPLGNQARISSDCGRTWSDAIIISGDGANTDLGYPSTVQLDDGRLVTVWYEVLAGNKKAQLRQARWRLN